MEQGRLIIVTIFILLLFSISTSIVSAATPTVVKGRVFIDNVQTKPDAVHLLVADENSTATLYEDGSYIVVSTIVTPGVVGTFSILYQSSSYTLVEILTLEENVSLYELDLHITTSNQTPAPPVPDAGGPYFEFVGVPLRFDGTGSDDPDGIIMSYEWDFGDTTTAFGSQPLHTYHDEGNYTVILRVIDDDGNTAQRSTFAFITSNPHPLPLTFQLIGPTAGGLNTTYSYTIQTLVPITDIIQYVINWGDDSNITTTDFIHEVTSVTVNHSWSAAGGYTITVYAQDTNNTKSETTELLVLINVHYVGVIGYLRDTQNDGIYDLFYSLLVSLFF